MSKIINNSRLPLYHQLYDIIVDKIENGTYHENDKLPSERELCEQYDISRATVRRAMVELEKNDYIYKKQGKGVFISEKAFEQDLLSFYSFTEEMKKVGKAPSSNVIEFETIKANAKISENLKIPLNQKVYKFTRLRLADEVPMMLETTYLPKSRFSGLTKELLSKKAMYDIFSDKYNVDFEKAEETFKATAINSREEKYLEVKKDSPAILLKRFTYENNDVIEYTVSVARGDKFRFHVVLE
ncbi:transcriptional regulator, GntR family [Halanaerobium praevalens DSM 2228]|uniref:Transcriptional regulator, GntR family n=1 Tax=Halanaerobium praevalens (strain ATCC 33744 / DSM 2228 / GSL) TaxID=572479 RepID=E3DNI3_HALPG|nr:transcriptional regulator, GntR family [Halanaerobium praevalens DSM 2228]